MKRASRPTSIEPAVRATTAHLTVVDDALVPWPMAFVAVLAWPRNLFARDVGEHCLDIATSFHVEPLSRPPLAGIAQGLFARQLFA